MRSTRWTGLILPALGVLSLTASCMLSVRVRHFWTDELLTYYLVSEPSFPRMLDAWRDLINAAPPLYFIVGWGWTQLFGATELSLRLLSSLCFSSAFLLIYWTLRPLYRSWPSSVAVLITFFACSELQFHNTEARFYPMLFAGICGAIAVLTKMTHKTKPSFGHLVANTLVHAMLVTIHYLGVIYSGLFLVATIVIYIKQKRALSSVLVSIGIGWLAFLPCLSTYLRHTEFGPPNLLPTLPMLLDAYDLQFGFPLTVLVLAALTIFIHRLPLDPSATTEEKPDLQTRRSQNTLLLVTFGLALLPAAMWIGGRLTHYIYFTNRYFFPAFLAWTVILAQVADHIDRRALQAAAATNQWLIAWAVRLLPKVVFSGLLFLFLLAPLAKQLMDPVSFFVAGRAEDYLEPEIPIVFEEIHSFLQRAHYGEDRDRTWIILDLETARDPDAAPYAEIDQEIIYALSRHFSYINTVASEQFLSENDRFLVADTVGYLWFENRIATDSRYRWRELDVELASYPLMRTPERVLLVEKIPAPTPIEAR